MKTDVRFYLVKKDVSAEKATLLSQFPAASAADLHQEEVKIGKQKVIYFTIAGTYRYRDATPKPDQLWIGAGIDSGKNQYIYARMMGPRDEVEDATPAFKRMVENAIRERDLN